MTRALTFILMIVTLSSQAASLPSFLGQGCRPGNPYCKVGPGGNPPAVQLDKDAPKPCAPGDTECIKTYTDTQTHNYQSAVKDPSFVSPVHGGGSCILSDQKKCDPAENNWQSNTVKPVSSRQLDYNTGNRPEFEDQKCKSVYSPFSRTTTQNCNH